ncbi:MULTISPECIES: FtsW/RodA/SpoVE family cell cycle protein [Caproicibacterium]|jgi:rod shape determining protein RodA|uniref:Rod shape-determining protein RodA n=1 Tax=Caproicibacterium lactatifermentans TaxID=2666138 RepID=A0A859DQ26_9FIRM|nr:FtsW/RodA/SpoVE family cell cycle protein [Caproicibacterium lactatifermentans]MDD4808150.1 FtsW/RodA/SpoVE family cell cycle protein [Oscillospiraceae bacterium]QKN24197.1 rod shape-determining protein RodA [Caproicibacterium lactatifermentans]QKO30734.1 rod shape-determining protein RodA [Caproicibacterium lactatifermentans]
MNHFGARAADYFRRTDKFLWVVMLLISTYNLLLLKTVPRTDGGRSWLSVQLMAIIVGYIGAVLLSLVDYHTIGNYWYMVGGFCIFLILLTLVKGVTIEGTAGVAAKAWLKLPGGMTFQSSELVKIGFLITFGKHLDELRRREELDQPLQVLLLAAHAMIPIVLTHLQKDDGAAVIFAFMFLFMAFAAGVQLRYFAALAGVLAVMIPIVWKFGLEDYQKTRLLTFQHPEADPQGYGFQQLAGKLSISSGQLTGRGLFVSPRVNSSSVPLQWSDFIFSVAGEELGFVGCVGILVLLIALMLVCLRNARRAEDLLGSSICVGFFAIIFSQTLFNIGMCLNLLPVMGVTLPFFSSGGSSVMCLYFGFGLVESVAVHRKRNNIGQRLFLD